MLDVVVLFLKWQIDLANLHHLPGGIVFKSTNVFGSLNKYLFLTSGTNLDLTCITFTESIKLDLTCITF